MRLGKGLLIWMVAFLTAVDPAAACRWRARRCCPPVYYVPCAPVTCCDATTTNYAPTEAPTPQPTLPPKSESGTLEFVPQPAPAEATPAPAPATTPAPEPARAEPPTPAFPEPAPVAPAAKPAPEPAAEPLSDPAPEMPAEPAAAPKADSDVEDLFKEAPAEKTPAADAPAAEPAAEPAKPADDVEDLFKDVDDKKAAATEAPAAPEEKKSDELEDLFSDPNGKSVSLPATKAVEPTPTSGEKTVRAEADKLFAEGSANTQSATGAASELNPMRSWTDNTGRYKIKARLVQVTATHVRLLKDTGKYTTVPFQRLSKEDLAFARGQADALVAN